MEYIKIQEDAPDASTKAYIEKGGRLLAVDFLRGFIMVLLTLESTQLYTNLFKINLGPIARKFLTQFFHHPWHGLRFWDLVQPIFMFVAGAAMAFSLSKQSQTHSRASLFRKVFTRSLWLFFWGVLDYAVRERGLSFELWDVLTQLSFTTLVAFMVWRQPFAVQLLVSVACLIIPESLYRFANIPGFDQPFTDQHNFGNYVDLLLMNKINSDGWVAINCISTSAHTIWGLMAGQLLLSKKSQDHKVGRLLGAGMVALALGFSLDWLHITPIIKRIATSSFVLASGGWVLLFLTLCYWWIDVKKHSRNLTFFTIVGMNSLFIYLFFEIVGDRWFNGYIGALSGGLLQMIHTPAILVAVITSICIFVLEWQLCNFLYKRKIFFKL